MLSKKLINLFLFVLLIAGCGDGSDNNFLASVGGVGGTGTGTITGFGSIIINDTKRFDVNASTTINLDSEAITESQLAEGMIVQVDIGKDVSADFSTGTALLIEAATVVKGFVTSVTPLQVLNQDILVTGDTVLANIPSSDIALLSIGDEVEVYGYADHNNVFQASRIDLKSGGIDIWKLTGTVSNLVADTSFVIGTQTVEFNNSLLVDCGTALGTPLVNGDQVAIKASTDVGFSPGSALTTVISVECPLPGLHIPADSPAVMNAQVEGFVNALYASPSEFEVNGQSVFVNDVTEYLGGTFEDIEVGVRLEAEGDLDTSTGILTADKIRFRDTRVRIEAPVASAAVIAGESLTIMGIKVTATISTVDRDNVISTGVADQQVEVRGFIDNSGAVYANRVTLRGTSDPTNVRLRGPVSNIATNAFEILGVMIAADTATGLFDQPGTSLSLANFMALLVDGSEIDVQNGSYADLFNIIDNADIQLEN